MKKRAKRRYNLHYKFRKETSDLAECCTLSAKDRAIYVPTRLSIQIAENKYARALRDEFQYSIQLSIE